LHCVVCGENAVFTQETFRSFDYESFTQSPISNAVICSPFLQLPLLSILLHQVFSHWEQEFVLIMIHAFLVCH